MSLSSHSRRWWGLRILAVACVLIAASSITFIATLQRGEITRTKGVPYVQPPVSGPLGVQGQQVEQLAATCGQGACVFDHSAERPLVTATARELPLQVHSVRPVTVSATDQQTRLQARGFSVRDGVLRFPHVPAGTYAITVNGDAGAAWSFDLRIPNGDLPATVPTPAS